MKSLLVHATLFILAMNCLNGQSVALDSVQVERVARVSQLWGHLKYFHPYLADPAIDWDGAFTRHIGGVIEADGREAYARAVQQMLDYLDDSATQVVSPGTPAAAETLKYPLVEFDQDSVLLVSVRDYRGLADFNYASKQFNSLKEKIPQSTGVIVDLRTTEVPHELKGYLSYYFAEIESHLSAEKLFFPGLRARFHDGFVPETGGTSGGYYSGFYTTEEKDIIPDSTAVSRPMVFVVNQASEIPKVALALQLADEATIISSDTLTDASLVAKVYYELGDSLGVVIRKNQLPEGTAVQADYRLPEEELIPAARQLIRGEAGSLIPHRPESSLLAGGAESRIAQPGGEVYPDLGHRLLAAAKIWTVIDYFFAYQDLMEEDRDSVLREFIPRMASAADSTEYHLAVAEMYTHLRDGHGFIRSSVLSHYLGKAAPPLSIRFIEEQAVVTTVFPDSVANLRGLEVGDVIREVDGEKVADRIARLARFTAASNQSALYRVIARSLLAGEDSTTLTMKIKKADGTEQTLSLPRTLAFQQYSRQLGNGRNDTPVTRLISDDIGYADLDRLTPDQVGQMLEDFRDTQAIIFDMRGYPHGTAWAIAPHLTDKTEVYAANFRRYSPMEVSLGSTTHMSFFDQPIPPSQTPTYRGKTVMLIDERTMSQAEHTGLFFEAANGTTFVGSQTAGANGDVTNFRIPGNMVLFFSGHDVRHIDGRQLQQIGLEPDVPVKPTIRGIREGKDEVLDRAIEYTEGLIRQSEVESAGVNTSSEAH